MKTRAQKNILIGIVGFALCTLGAIISLKELARNSLLLAQSKTTVVSDNNPAVQSLPVNKNAVGTSKTFLTTSPLSYGAEQNELLKTKLNWNFGGKLQYGWYIYEPLICGLLGVENETDANNFADALAQWQQFAGLNNASGVLDEPTLSAMIANWQSQRLKNKSELLLSDAIIAPPNDFYSPSRPAELRQIERKTYEAYKKMVRAAAADKSLNLQKTQNGDLADSESFLKIISSYRSRDYQAKLRLASPNSGRAGLALNSPHFTGRALDIYVGGDPVSTKDPNRALQVKTPVYKWLVKNAGKFGFKPYFYEPWHWEYAPDDENQ